MPLRYFFVERMREHARQIVAFSPTSDFWTAAGWAAFCAQQSTEKAVKGILQSQSGSAKGHAITGALQSLRAGLEVPEAVTEAGRELNGVYGTARYFWLRQAQRDLAAAATCWTKLE